MAMPWKKPWIPIRLCDEKRLYRMIAHPFTVGLLLHKPHDITLIIHSEFNEPTALMINLAVNPDITREPAKPRSDQ